MAILSNQYAHWHQFFEDGSVSPQDFYQKLQKSLEDHKVPETHAARVDFLERGLMSSKRIYLQIKRDWLTYQICVAPFGTGFFASSRLLTSTWNSWPILLIPLFLVPIIPFVTYVLTVLIFRSALAAFFLGSLAFFPAVFIFFLSVLLWFLRCRMTYYRVDTMMAFQEAIHRLVIKQVNETIQADGLKPLTDEESKPVLHKLLRR